MTAAVELRSRAEMFGWEIHCDDARLEDTFIHDQNMVAVNYRRDGSVDQGYRYVFNRITDLKLQERTGPRNKKSAVLGWLVNLGH